MHNVDVLSKKLVMQLVRNVSEKGKKVIYYCEFFR